MTKLLAQLPYVHVGELVTAWGLSLAQFSTFAVEGLIEVCVMALGQRIVEGHYDVDDDQRLFAVPDDYRTVHGPQPLTARDVWLIIRDGAANITCFKAPPDRYIELRDDEALTVSANDLLVWRAERERFEEMHGLASQDASTPALVHQGFLHSPDYTDVTVSGRSYRFGLKQAAIVRALHEAALSDNPWREGRSLLERAGSNSLRMVDLFRSQRHWRELIQHDGRGSWRLRLPESALQGRRKYRRPLLRLVG